MWENVVFSKKTLIFGMNIWGFLAQNGFNEDSTCDFFGKLEFDQAQKGKSLTTLAAYNMFDLSWQ